MGLATAARWRPVPDWTDAVRLALERALDEQRADGSWGYEPRRSEHGGHPGAADLTVYYHGRCLAFLLPHPGLPPRPGRAAPGERPPAGTGVPGRP